MLVVVVVFLLLWSTPRQKVAWGGKEFILQLPGHNQSEGSDRAWCQGEESRGQMEQRPWEESRSPACSACFLLPPRTTCPGHCPQSTGLPTSTVYQENGPQVCLQSNLMEAVLKVLSSQMTMFVSIWQKLASSHVSLVSVCLPVSVYHWGHFLPSRTAFINSFFLCASELYFLISLFS